MIGAGGALSIALVPNVGATPIGSYYTVVYHLDDGERAAGVLGDPGERRSPVTLAAVKNTVLPTSVAMQDGEQELCGYGDCGGGGGWASAGWINAGYVLKTGDTMTGPLGVAGGSGVGEPGGG